MILCHITKSKQCQLHHTALLKSARGCVGYMRISLTGRKSVIGMQTIFYNILIDWNQKANIILLLFYFINHWQIGFIICQFNT
jgi:hypothetical protein